MNYVATVERKKRMKKHLAVPMMQIINRSCYNADKASVRTDIPTLMSVNRASCRFYADEALSLRFYCANTVVSAVSRCDITVGHFCFTREKLNSYCSRRVTGAQEIVDVRTSFNSPETTMTDARYCIFLKICFLYFGN